MNSPITPSQMQCALRLGDFFQSTLSCTCSAPSVERLTPLLLQLVVDPSGSIRLD